MGTGIACHLANAGFSCLLLDILPPDLAKEEESSREARNRLAATALKKALKAKSTASPAAWFRPTLPAFPSI